MTGETTIIITSTAVMLAVMYACIRTPLAKEAATRKRFARLLRHWDPITQGPPSDELQVARGDFHQASITLLKRSVAGLILGPICYILTYVILSQL